MGVHVKYFNNIYKILMSTISWYTPKMWF